MAYSGEDSSQIVLSSQHEGCLIDMDQQIYLNGLESIAGSHGLKPSIIQFRKQLEQKNVHQGGSDNTFQAVSIKKGSSLDQKSIASPQYDVYYSEQSKVLEQKKLIQTDDLPGFLPPALNQLTLNANQAGAVSSENASETRKLPSKKNECLTKNMLQFFWKVFRNFIDRRVAANLGPEELRRQWENLRVATSSLMLFTKLFNFQPLRSHISELFKTGHLKRQIIRSGVDRNLRMIYMRHVQTLCKGFITRRLNYLS